MTVPVTFTKDIGPIFSKWASRMAWRLDLAKYEDVKANASIIYGQISSGNMPPPDYDSLTPQQIDLFKQWMDQGCPE